LIAHFEGRCSLEEAVERIKIETRRFAKNQRTWLRRLRATPGSVWVDAGSMETAAVAERVVDELVGRE
jgi:tRNA dimethylallyltransferase